ncbi:MAG: alpha/beta hydrolase [Anaerobacillus sp.]
MVRSLPIYGLGLQVVFFYLFFSAQLPKMNNLIGATTCLILGFSSLTLASYSVKHSNRLFLSILVIILAIVIISFTIVAYFLGEAGYPSLIRVA